MPKRKLVYVISNVSRPVTFEWIVDSKIGKDYELTFVLMNPCETPFELSLKARGVPVHRIPYFSKRNLPRATFEISRLFRAIRPDVVHTHLVDANLAGLTAARLCGVPKRIHTRHHSDPHHLRHRHAVIYDRLANFLSTDIVVASQNVREVLKRLESVKDSKIQRISFGIKFSDFDSVSTKDVDLIREKYQLLSKTPVIGMVSRYLKIKGLQFAIPAFQEFLKSYPDACLLIANASGAYAPAVKELLARLPNGSFREIAFENEMIALYQVMDAFIHVPIDAVSEAFGQAYTESLAAGLPAIFTLSGVAPEFVVNEVNALVVDFQSSDQILAALKKIFSNREQAKQMAEQGRADVRRIFDIQEYIDKLYLLYRS